MQQIWNRTSQKPKNKPETAQKTKLEINRNTERKRKQNSGDGSIRGSFDDQNENFTNLQQDQDTIATTLAMIQQETDVIQEVSLCPLAKRNYFNVTRKEKCRYFTNHILKYLR